MLYRATLHDRKQNSALPVQIRMEPGAMCIIPEIGPETEWQAADIGHIRATDDGLVIVQNGHLFLEVEEPGFKQHFERIYGGQKRFSNSFFDSMGLKGCLIIILLFLLPMLLLYFFGLPWLTEKAVNNVSIEQEKSISKPMYEALLKDSKVDMERSILLQEFYDSLHYDSRYHYELTVMKSPVVNAFAMPGGHIVVYDSLLNAMQKPEELAALIGHESGHIDLKHSLRGVFRALGSSLFFTFLLGDYGDISGIVARKANQLSTLSYSRDMELEADKRGAELMQAQGISLQGMHDLFMTLKGHAEPHAEGAGHSDFFSTHPSVDERLGNVGKWIDAPNHRETPMRTGLLAIWEKLKKQ